MNEDLAKLEAIVGERMAFWVAPGRSVDELRAALPGDLAWIECEARKLGVPEDAIALGLRNLMQTLTVDGRRLFPA